MKIALGSDHAGFHMKNLIREMLAAAGHDISDLGSANLEPTDYPDWAVAVGTKVSAGEVDLGILVCGTGIGMSMAANKVPGVRAAATSDPVSARLAREHNNANVVCLGSRIVGPEVGLEIARTFVEAQYSGGERHERRISKITAIEETHN